MKRPVFLLAAFWVLLGAGSWGAWRLGRASFPAGSTAAPPNSEASVVTVGFSPDSTKPTREKGRSVLADIASRDAAPLTDEEFAAALTEAGKLMKLVSDGPSDLSGFRTMAQLAVLASRATPEQRRSLDNLMRSGGDGVPGVDVLEVLGAGRRKAKIDPEQVKKELSDPTVNADGASMKLMSWAAQDPFAAMDFLLAEIAREKPAAWADPWMLATAYGFAGVKDYAKAMDLAAAVGPEKLRSEAMNGVGGALASYYAKASPASDSDRDEWLKAYLSHPRAVEGDNRAGNLASVVRARLAWEPPDRMLQWADSLALAPPMRKKLDRSIYDAWMVREPGAAADWLLSRREAADRPEVVLTTLRRWTRAPNASGLLFSERSPTFPTLEAVGAAADWLIGQGTGPENAAAVQTLAEAYLRVGEPAAALKWAHAIAEPSLREVTLNAITRHIQRRFPDTAADILAKESGQTPEKASP